MVGGGTANEWRVAVCRSNRRYNSGMQAEAVIQERQGSSLVWRVAGPSLAASAALLAIAALAAVSLFEAQREAERVLRDVEAADAISDELQSALEQVRGQLVEFAANGDDQSIANLSKLRDATLSYRFKVEGIHNGDGVVDLDELRRMLSGLEQVVRSLEVADSNAQRRVIAEHLVDQILDGDLLARAAQQRQLTRLALSEARLRSRELTNWTGWTLLLLGVAGSGAGVLAGFGLARSLRQQLVELSVPIRTAAGSLDEVVGPVQVRSGGEVEDIENSLNSLASRVASVVERLQAAERESLRNDQLAALGQLAAGLAHELRNPLTAVRTLVEAARSRGADAQLDGRDLEVVEEEISRLDSTLQSFLDYARPPVLERRPIDVRDVIQRTVQLVNARAELQSVRLEMTLPSDPLVVSADAEQLRQVLLNLLLNALDSLGGGGRITVSAELDTSAGQIVLTIADSGPGIPPAIRDKLFDPFVSSKPSGTGLGLTICRRIVENHGGTITADNAPSGGAVFTVRLPWR